VVSALADPPIPRRIAPQLAAAIGNACACSANAEIAEIEGFRAALVSCYLKQSDSLSVEYPMIERIRPRRTALLPRPPLLMTESREDFDQVCDTLEREIQPRGSIEQMYVDDMTYIVWEIRRLRRCKDTIINVAFRTGLERVLKQLLRRPGEAEFMSNEEESEDLALRWFTDPKAKKKVSELLGKFQLDEIAIEAEAIRESSQYLEQLDRRLCSLEVRRDIVLARVVEYRGNLAHQLREAAERMTEEPTVLRLETSAGKKSA
jgi:hypothetical protein